jgi:hypothetical protein
VLDEFSVNVERRWPDLARRQAAIRAEAEARIVEQRWSQSSWAMEVRPYYVERNELPAVRLCRRRPEDLDGWVEYGFDDLGRCVLVREHGYGRPQEEQVFLYGDGTDEVLDFQWVPDWVREESGGEEYKLVAVEQHRRDAAGCLQRWARIVRGDRFEDAPARLSWEDYEYRADGALSQVVEQWPIYDQERAFGGLAVGDIAVSRDEFTYDDAGDLVSIRSVPPYAHQQPRIVWRRRPASLRPALRKVEDVLVEYTVGWAREHWPDEPVYCLGLIFHGSKLALDAAFGTRAFMQEMLDDPEEDGPPLELWNPAEFGIEHAFALGRDDPEFTEAAAALEQEWRRTGDLDACFKLLARAAKRLNADDRLNLPRTDAFVVFAIDPEIHEQPHVERQLRACIPADTFKKLKRAGLLTGAP